MNDDTQTQDQPAMNGDDELAKTLSGGLKFEETPPSGMSMGDDQAASDNGAPADDNMPPTMSGMPNSDDSANDEAEETHDDVPMIPPHQEPNGPISSEDEEPAAPAPHHDTGDLDGLKSSALDDLKPLVGKLNLSAEEKFDTLLLIIRSTDDQSLLAEAHAAAKEISDDTKRAQALLDIIKEVDYFKNKT